MSMSETSPQIDTCSYDTCDMCGKKTINLADHFCLLCIECRHFAKELPLGVLSRIGNLCSKVERLELDLQIEKNKNTVDKNDIPIKDKNA